MLELYRQLGSTPGPGDDNRTPEGRTDMANKVIAHHLANGVDEQFFYGNLQAIWNWRYERGRRQRRAAALSRWQKEKSKAGVDNKPETKS